MYPVPATEKKRLKALRDLTILDTPRTPEFDAICRLASELFDVPVALVTLIDRDRQWLKASHGVDLQEIPRSYSFCAHTIMTDDVMVVPDATLDPRFQDNPFVTGEASVRFYAGAPISFRDGLRMGSVCLIDRHPRQFRESEQKVLQDLAQIVNGLLSVHASEQRAKHHSDTSEGQKVLLRQQQRDLWRQNKMLIQTERMAQIGGWEWSVERDVLTMSDEIYHLMEIPPGTRLNRDSILAIYDQPGRQKLEQAVEDALASGASFDMELPFTTTSGQARWAHVLGEVERQDGKVARLFGVLQDITSRRETNRQIWHMANHDSLTGLPNRNRFQKRFNEALAKARQDGEKLALVLMDLDHFKDVNDTVGHHAGDAILVGTSRQIKSVLNSSDTVARLGGDEFAILLTGLASEGDVAPITGRLLAAAASPETDWPYEFKQSASLGVAIFPDHGSDVNELMQNADIALYRAKADGRARAQIFTPEMRTSLTKRLHKISEFRAALEAGQIHAFYQPQIRLSDQALYGFEALARWCSPDQEILTISHFQPALENPDIAIRLGEQMLDSITRDMRTWLDKGLPPRKVSINVTAPELRRGDYPAKVARIFASRNLPLALLTVEVTETVILSERGSQLADALLELRGLGAHIALDDFGTGFASLIHLKTYPIDQIKIDRSFISGLTSSSDDEAIVKAMIGLAKNLDIDAVAEGIETERQLDALKNLGCTYVQGYLFSPALSVDMAEGHLRTASLISRLG